VDGGKRARPEWTRHLPSGCRVANKPYFCRVIHGSQALGAGNALRLHAMSVRQSSDIGKRQGGHQIGTNIEVIIH